VVQGYPTNEKEETEHSQQAEGEESAVS